MIWAVASTTLPANAGARPVFEKGPAWGADLSTSARVPIDGHAVATLDPLQNRRRRTRQSNQPKGDLEKSSLGRSALICGPVIVASSTLVGGTSSSQRRTLMHLDIGPLY